MKRLRRVAWAAVAVLALVLAGLRLRTGRNPAAASSGLSAYGTALPLVPAPGLSLQLAGGGTLSLGALRGHSVVLVFVDPQAADAARTAALLRDVALEAPADVSVLAVDSAPPPTPASFGAWAAAQGLPGRVRLLGGSQAAVAAVDAAYHLGSDVEGTTLLPVAATYLIDPRGRERWVLSTAQTAAAVAAEAHALAAAAVALRG